MSDQIRNGGRTGGVWPWPTTNPTLGVTADEIKVAKPNAAKDPFLQPIPEVRATEFLNPTKGSDHLRLSPPAAANPMATATGPIHDHFKVRTALDKAKGANAQELHKFLQSPDIAAIPEDRKTQMKTSVAREQAMVTLLRSVHDMQERIYSKVIGSAEA